MSALIGEDLSGGERATVAPEHIVPQDGRAGTIAVGAVAINLVDGSDVVLVLSIDEAAVA